MSDETSAAYQWGYHLAETLGIEAAIEVQAAGYNELIPGLGDALRHVWTEIRDGGFLTLPFAAASSGAADELEYFA